MKESEIYEEAKKALFDYRLDLRYTKTGTFKSGFIAGVKWLLTASWNKASEKVPEAPCMVIVRRNDASAFSICQVNAKPESCPKEWESWAYINNFVLEPETSKDIAEEKIETSISENENGKESKNV